MSVLSGPEIVRLVNQTRKARDTAALLGGVWPPEWNGPLIDIDPWDERWVGPNSVDLHLASLLLVYPSDQISPDGTPRTWLDAREPNMTVEVAIPPSGLLLCPGELYLGSTVERTWCAGLVPAIETRSSIARLGISTHLSAGFGDEQFNGQWTLEITVAKPVKVYAHMRVCQIAFQPLLGASKPYVGKYQHSTGPGPSRFWQDLHSPERSSD